MLSAERVLGALVLLKAADVLARGPRGLPGAAWALVLALWVAGGVALVCGRSRSGFAALVVGGVGLAVDLPLELRRQHLVLLVGVALAGLVARSSEERLVLWRVQLSALYGVAALAKLNESVLGGDVLGVALVTGPLHVLPPPVVLVGGSIALVVVEALLALSPWQPVLRTPAVVVGAALHLGTLGIATGPLVALRLVVFGGTAVLLLAVSAGYLGCSRAAPSTRTTSPLA